jgi:AcrR family transcriptional regulator
VAADDEVQDEDLWIPFLALREDPRATRLREHVQEDIKRGRPHPPRRAGALSRREIVRAAIGVADAEGADAVSMRRIARELHAGTMSLYWHVASKEELLDLMIDAIEGEAEAPEPSGDWRADLAATAHATRSALLRHQWVVNFLAARPPTGPSALRNIERSLGTLDGLGLDMQTAVTILTTLATYVVGSVVREFQERCTERHQAELAASHTGEELADLVAAFRERARGTGRYPHLVAMMDAGVDPDAAGTRDARFEFGLECLLDGVAARVTQPAAAARRPPPAP